MTRGIGLLIDGAENVAGKVEGGAEVDSQFGVAFVTFLSDCSISCRLAFPHFFQQYLAITSIIRSKITSVRISAIPKNDVPLLETLKSPIFSLLMVSSLVFSSACDDLHMVGVKLIAKIQIRFILLE